MVPLEKISRLCDRILSVVVSVFSIVMVVIAGLQIVARAVFDLPLSWSEETATYMFIWWVYLGAALAVRTKNHLGIDYLVSRFPPRLLRLNTIFVHVLMFSFVVLMFQYGIYLARTTMNDLTPITQIPFGLLFLIQPICGVFMAVFIVEILVREVKSWGQKPEQS
jgi:TRAP-type C4-dicarboxylate transport system permease small subunit